MSTYQTNTPGDSSVAPQVSLTGVVGAIRCSLNRGKQSVHNTTKLATRHVAH
jgi:hypothetical protein